MTAAALAWRSTPELAGSLMMLDAMAEPTPAERLTCTLIVCELIERHPHTVRAVREAMDAGADHVQALLEALGATEVASR